MSDSAPIRVRTDKHPDAIAPSTKKAVDLIVAVICGDWTHCRELAHIANAETRLPDQDWHDTTARTAILVKALQVLGFVVEPPEGWTCDVRGCRHPVGHSGRCTWMTSQVVHEVPQ